MRRGTCVACNESHPLSRMFYARRGVHCRTCVDLLLKDPHVPIQAGELRPLVDPTVCAGCEQDSPVELKLVSGLRVCEACIAKFKRPPIPASLFVFWLTMLAALGLAVDRAFVWGGSARDLRQAEQAASRGDVSAARRLLQDQPPSEKRDLLEIHVDLLSEKTDEARIRLASLRGRWILGGLARTVHEELLAMVEAAAARQLVEQGKPGQAHAAIKHAYTLFPQSVPIQKGYLQIFGMDAFSQKRYDEYIQAHSMLGDNWPNDVDAVLSHAAAMAAVWALKGDESARKRARELLDRARKLSKDSEAVLAFEKFVERRIETRVLEEFQK